MAFWLIAVFLLGGSSRSDVTSLPILRPLSVLILALGMVTLSRDHVRRNAFALFLIGAAIALILLQSVPLPPVIVYNLPGREILAEIDRVGQLGPVWRPMTMAPAATRNAFWAMVPAAATLVLAVQLSASQATRLTGLIVFIGFASGILGLLQILGGPDSGNYLYAVTNDSSAVGLFANRNHQALFLACMVPTLIAWLQSHERISSRTVFGRLRWSTILIALATVFLTPLLLVTGSRNGVLCAILGLASLGWLKAGERSTANPPKRWSNLLPVLSLVVVVAALVAISIWFDRAEAYNRLTGGDPALDMRVKILPSTWSMFILYFPWGSGVGSFEQVYQIHEPDRLLDLNYVNHAHNDWLELAVTGGLPAIVLLGVASVGLVIRGYGVAKASAALPGAGRARHGLIILAIFGFASLSDYPLRVPSLACLFMLALVSSHCRGGCASADSSRQGSPVGASPQADTA